MEPAPESWSAATITMPELRWARLRLTSASTLVGRQQCTRRTAHRPRPCHRRVPTLLELDGQPAADRLLGHSLLLRFADKTAPTPPQQIWSRRPLFSSHRRLETRGIQRRPLGTLQPHRRPHRNHRPCPPSTRSGSRRWSRLGTTPPRNSGRDCEKSSLSSDLGRRAACSATFAVVVGMGIALGNGRAVSGCILDIWNHRFAGDLPSAMSAALPFRA